MIRRVRVPPSHIDDRDWVGFPGGELEGRRPRALCAACRSRLRPASTLCFHCYRLELDRQRALKSAGELNTASPERFQTLPFEPVDAARLARLRAGRAAARVEARAGVGRFEERRRQAQIAARRALQTLTAGLAADRVPAQRGAAGCAAGAAAPIADAQGIGRELGTALLEAAHAAELQLPEAWLPFVVVR